MAKRHVFAAARAVALIGLFGVTVSGCSSTASQILTTGSLFGSTTPAQAPAAAAPVPVQPVDRALQVAAVSARAQKCGYVFDPAALRANYLAFEATGGVDADALAGLGERYDFTLRKVASAIAAEDEYCSQEQVGVIKADLNRHLAGDFTPRKKAKEAPSASWLDLATESEPKPFDREKAFDPNARR